MSLTGCTTMTFLGAHRVPPPNVSRLAAIVLTIPAAPSIETLAGGQLLRDGGAVCGELAIERAILRTNPRIAPAFALALAVQTGRSARHAGLPPEFLAATLLQESAYDPGAISAAGAMGAGQFIAETADAAGVDPFDPFAAIDASARLLGGYVGEYASRYADPYAAALAAYNAGPGAVEQYHGIPPYPETREYVALIDERMMRIAGYAATGVGAGCR